MYGHPNKPDPWSERQEIPPYPESGPSGYVVLWVMVVPVFSLAFALGYVSGVMGWFF